MADDIRNADTDKPFIVWGYCSTVKKGEGRYSENAYRRFHSCAWACRGYKYLVKARNNLRVDDLGFDCINKPSTDYIHFIDKTLVAKIEHPGSIGHLRSIAGKYLKQENEWMNYVLKTVIGQIEFDADWKHLFPEEWNDYKILLKELLSSYKYLTDEHKELL